MERQTLLTQHLNSGRFEEAVSLLERHLQNGDLLNPRTDSLWSSIADEIAYAIQKILGQDATILFWEGLRDFFINVIEPSWGSAHKGHIYFRLGFAVAKYDFARARSEFESAYQEDLLLEEAKGGTPAEIMQRSYEYSAYVALTILERINDADFSTTTDKEQFVNQLFGPSFDAAIIRLSVEPGLVYDAFTAIAPAAALPACQALYAELQHAAAFALPFATVSLTGTVLESLLLADLYHRRGVTTLPNSRDIRCVELGPLLREAIRYSIFPTASVRTAFELVQIFRNRLHPGNELRQSYKLVPRVAITLKLLFERAVLEWRTSFP